LAINFFYVTITSEVGRNEIYTSPQLEPSDIELAVLSNARAILDNKTDKASLGLAIIKSLEYLKNQSVVAHASNYTSTIYIRFKSGSDAVILARLKLQTNASSNLTLGIQTYTTEETKGVVSPSPRRVVIFEAFQWQHAGSSYRIFDEYIRSLFPKYIASAYYIPNSYVTLDKIANFFLGPHIYDSAYSWVRRDDWVEHEYYGIYLFSSHGGYSPSTGTIFATGEEYNPKTSAGVESYRRYSLNIPGSVILCQVSGDSRTWIAITTTFFNYLFRPAVNSLFYADTCDGLVSTDMAYVIINRGGYVYLGWTGSITAPGTFLGGQADKALDLFFKDLCKYHYNVEEAMTDIKNNGFNKDFWTGATLEYYPYDHGDWYICDITPPSNPTTWSSSHKLREWSSDNTIEVSWSGATDDLSGVYGYSCVWDTSPSTTPDEIVDQTTTFCVSPPLSTGSSWYFHLRTVDKDGNWNPSALHIGPFYIDITPPNTPSLSEGHCGSTWTTHNSPYFTWNNPGDTGSGVAFYEGSLDDGIPFPVSSPYHPTLSDGAHTFKVRAVDNVGLRGGWSNIITVRIDTTPPAGVVYINENRQYTTSTSVYLKVEAVDKGSGVKEMRFRNEGESWGEWQAYTTSPVPWNLPSGDGRKRVYVQFRDFAGNPSGESESYDEITLDTTPPTVPTLSFPNDGWRVDPKPTFSWIASSDSTSGVAGYILEIDTSTSFNSGNLRRYEVTATSYQLTQELSLGTWYWRVRARDNAGNLGDFGSVRRIIVDRIKVTSGGVSDDRVDVGVPITVWFKAVYETDNLAFDNSKGILYIDGRAATWSSSNGRWELIESYSTVQKRTYKVTGVTDTTYGLTGINHAAIPQEVIWDRIKIIRYGVSDDRVNVGSTQTIYVAAVYEYDNSPFTNGVLKINETVALYDPSTNSWRISFSASQVARYTFRVSSVSDSVYGLTAFSDPQPTIAIIWDRVKIDAYGTSSGRVNVGDVGTVWFVLRYEYDNSPVVDGVVVLNNSSPMTWSLANNRWEFSESLGSVGKKSYYINTVKNNAFNITVLAPDASTKLASIIWDRMKVTGYGVSDERADVGLNQRVYVTIAYEYDNKPVTNGQVYVNGSLATYDSSLGKWVASVTSSSVGKTVFKVSAAKDGTYGLSVLVDLLTPPSIIWDRIRIYEGGVSASLANTGTSQTVWAKAKYEYDGLQFNSTCGTLYVNGSAMVWSSSRARWEYNYSSVQPKTLTFVFSSAQDRQYGLTVVHDTTGPKRIAWTELHLDAIIVSPAPIVNTGLPVVVYARVVWAHNGSAIVGAQVNLNTTLASAYSNGTGWVSFPIGHQDIPKQMIYVLTPKSEPSGIITKYANRSTTITWTELRVSEVRVDKRITNTGSEIGIIVKVLWAHNFSACVGGIVGVNASSSTAVANSSGWARIPIVNNGIAEATYSVRALRDALGYVTKSNNMTTPKLTWTELRVTDIVSNATFLPIGANASIRIHAVWAHNGSDLVGGIIAVNGSQRVTNRTGWATVVIGRNTAGTFTVIGEAVSDASGQVTKCTTKGSLTVVWTGLRIDRMLWSKDFANISDVVKVYAHLVYAHNMSAIRGGRVGLNGTVAVTNNTGWAIFSIVADSPLSCVYLARGLRDESGTITVAENSQSHKFTWTAVKVNYIGSNSTISPINGTVRIIVRVVWAHNDTAIANALVELKGNSTVQQIRTNGSGYAQFDVTASAVGEYLFNATGKEASGITKSLGWKSIRIKFGTRSQVNLHLKKGYNLISLPVLNESLTASSLLRLIGNASQSVFMFNSSSQKFVSYDKKLVEFGIPQLDFSIEPNVGYFVYLSNDTTVTIVGIRNSFPRIIPLKRGYNLVGWTYVNSSRVKLAFMNFSFVDSVFAFNATSQRYVSYDRSVADFGIPQPDFDVNPGEGYFVFANRDECLYYGGG
jgi:hypothetical protein